MLSSNSALGDFTPEKSINGFFKFLYRRKGGVEIKMELTFNAEIKKHLTDTKIDKSCCRKAYNYGLSLFKDKDFTYIDRTYLKCPLCASHFLRGVFVTSGSVNAPDKSRHLEIKVDGKPEADELTILLTENGFDAKISERRTKNIVYFKDGDTIFGFLSFIGAQRQAFDFLDKIIENQMRNDINRKNNFETANMAKTAAATKKQLEAISYFYNAERMDELSEVLRATAELKYENPDLNLKELAELHTPPITKSCANHRLSKIIEQYEKMQKNRADS